MRRTAGHRVGQLSAGAYRACRIRHVLQQFHARDHIEVLRQLARQVLRCDLTVLDVVAAFEQMQLRDLERFFREVDAGHASAALRHALGENAAAAADVDHGFVFQCDHAVNVIEPQRVEIMQRLEFARGVPPPVREFAEFGDFAGVNVDTHGACIRLCQ